MIRQDIPEDWKIVGENLYATHSIKYHSLNSWFEGIFVWNVRNHCLSWDETLEWFALIGASAGLSITPVPVLYDGIYDEKAIANRWSNFLLEDERETTQTGQPRQEREGYVLRLADSFAYRNFRNSVCKWVRAGHVQTDQHWMQGPVVANGLRRS